MAPVCPPQKVVIEIVAPKVIAVNSKASVEITGPECIPVRGCVDISGNVKVDSHVSGGVDVKCECCKTPECCPVEVKPEVKKVPIKPVLPPLKAPVCK